MIKDVKHATYRVIGLITAHLNQDAVCATEDIKSTNITGKFSVSIFLSTFNLFITVFT
jgi:hypothetical protein